MQECERLAEGRTFFDRKFVKDARIVLPFAKDGVRYQFDFTIEGFIASRKPISPVSRIPTLDESEPELPNIYPLKCNISLATSNLYKRELIYRKLRTSEQFRFE